MDVKTLKGIAVVAIENGEKLGAVNDVLFSVDDRKIYAFTVGSGGLFGGTNHIVEMASVQSIGTDAIMVHDRNVLRGDRNEDRYRGYPDISAITSLRVVTDGGSYVGNVATVQIDEASGRMTDLEISRGGLTSAFKSNTVVPMDLVVSLGKDVAVIPDDYADTVEPASATEEQMTDEQMEVPAETTGEESLQPARGTPLS